MVIVIDANIIIACSTREPNFEKLLELTVGADEVVGPASLRFEIGNALTSLFKKRRAGLDQAIEAFELFDQMAIRLVDVDIRAAIRLAHRFRLYAYDAYILQCAIETGGSVLSLDRPLLSVARTANIPVVEVEQ